MKPSELVSSKRQREVPEARLKWPKDPKADPLITDDEALEATQGICPAHGGLMGAGRGEKEGTVYLCIEPRCRMYRRLKRRSNTRQLGSKRRIVI